MLGMHILCHMTSHDVSTCSKLTERIRDANEQNRKLKKRLSDLQASQRKTASARFIILMVSCCQGIILKATSYQSKCFY